MLYRIEEIDVDTHPDWFLLGCRKVRENVFGFQGYKIGVYTEFYLAKGDIVYHNVRPGNFRIYQEMEPIAFPDDEFVIAFDPEGLGDEIEVGDFILNRFEAERRNFRY